MSENIRAILARIDERQIGLIDQFQKHILFDNDWKRGIEQKIDTITSFRWKIIGIAIGGSWIISLILAYIK